MADSQRCESFGDRFRFEHHAFATAEWAIIDGAVAVVGKVAQIVNADRYQTLGPRTAHDAVLKYPGKEAGKDGDNLETHTWSDNIGESKSCTSLPEAFCGTLE